MRMSGQKGFEGWYFKHQKGDDMVAFIPGRAESGDFIQLISREGARQFQVSDLTVRNGMIQADRCWFSSQGCHIELPGISGEIVYGPLAPLCSDIMGPFRFFPWSAGTAFSAWPTHSKAASEWMDMCIASKVVSAM